LDEISNYIFTLEKKSLTVCFGNHDPKLLNEVYTNIIINRIY